MDINTALCILDFLSSQLKYIIILKEYPVKQEMVLYSQAAKLKDQSTESAYLFLNNYHFLIFIL